LAISVLGRVLGAAPRAPPQRPAVLRKGGAGAGRTRRGHRLRYPPHAAPPPAAAGISPSSSLSRTCRYRAGNWSTPSSARTATWSSANVSPRIIIPAARIPS
jgi:hypothetical protein